MRCQERLSPGGTKAAPRTHRGWGSGKSSNHLALQLLMEQPGPKPGLPPLCAGEGGGSREGRGRRQARDAWQRRGKSRSTGSGEMEEGKESGQTVRRGERTLTVSS